MMCSGGDLYYDARLVGLLFLLLLLRVELMGRMGDSQASEEPSCRRPSRRLRSRSTARVWQRPRHPALYRVSPCSLPPRRGSH